MYNRRMLSLVGLATFFGIGHHIDHIIRGNHVGWPLIPQITPFTYSLIVYPAIALGLYLYLNKMLGPGYWVVVVGSGLLFVGLLHFGPVAIEPPRDILEPYQFRGAGWFAVGWLVVFLLLLAATTLYASYLLVEQRRQRH